MFVLDPYEFKSAWTKFIEKKPEIIDDIMDFINEELLLKFKLEGNDIVKFFLHNFKFELVKGVGGTPDLVAIQVDYFGQPSDKAINNAKKHLISLGQNKNKIEEVFDSIFDNSEELDWKVEAFAEHVIDEIEKELGVKAYTISKATGTDFLGISVKDFVQVICFPVLNAEYNIKRDAVKNLVLFRGDDFEILEKILYNKIRDIYDREDGDSKYIMLFLNKINNENPSLLYNIIVDFVYKKYSDNFYEFVSTFVKDIERRAERVVKFEDTILNKLKELDAIWEEELVTMYFDMVESPDDEEYF